MPGIIGPGPGAGEVTGSTLPQGITPTRARFAVLVSKGTGLSLASVLAWIKAENGPDGNPLNIGPGRNYGTVDSAAQATISLLHSPTYAPVIAAAKQAPNDLKSQLMAIAESPWDACRYRGTNPDGSCSTAPVGSLLLGTLKGITGVGVSTVTAQGSVNTGSDSGQGLLSGVGGLFGGLAKWIQGEAATGLAYVIFAFLGVVLVVVGLLEVFGHTPSEGLALAATRGQSITRPKAGEPGSSQLGAGDSLPF